MSSDEAGLAMLQLQRVCDKMFHGRSNLPFLRPIMQPICILAYLPISTSISCASTAKAVGIGGHCGLGL